MDSTAKVTAELHISTQTTCVILFAKYPARDKAKTRLQPALGVDGAADMARQLLLHSIEQAVATDFAVELCVSPAPADPCWQVLDLPESLQWSAQAEGDLGKRMLTASQSALEKYEKVVLIGTDCPSLTAERIQSAVQQLDQHDAVMIPATDGGYVFIEIYLHIQSLLFTIYNSAALSCQAIRRANSQSANATSKKSCDNNHAAASAALTLSLCFVNRQAY